MDAWARSRAAPSPTSNTTYRRRRYQTPPPAPLVYHSHPPGSRMPSRRVATPSLPTHMPRTQSSSPSRGHGGRPPSSRMPSRPQSRRDVVADVPVWTSSAHTRQRSASTSGMLGSRGTPQRQSTLSTHTTRAQTTTTSTGATNEDAREQWRSRPLSEALDSSLAISSSGAVSTAAQQWSVRHTKPATPLQEVRRLSPLPVKSPPSSGPNKAVTSITSFTGTSTSSSSSSQMRAVATSSTATTATATTKATTTAMTVTKRSATATAMTPSSASSAPFAAGQQQQQDDATRHQAASAPPPSSPLKLFFETPWSAEKEGAAKRPIPGKARQRPPSGRKLLPLPPDAARSPGITRKKTSPMQPWGRGNAVLPPPPPPRAETDGTGAGKDEGDGEAANDTDVDVGVGGGATREEKAAQQPHTQQTHHQQQWRGGVKEREQEQDKAQGEEQGPSAPEAARRNSTGLRRQYSSPALIDMHEQPSAKQERTPSHSSSTSSATGSPPSPCPPKYTPEVSVCSMGGGIAGVGKENQDGYFIADQPGEANFFVGVLDGHGINGQKASAFVKKDLPARLSRRNVATGTAFAIKDSIKGSARALNRAGFSVRESGTTLVCVLKHARSLYVANIGDSRVVLGQRQTEGLTAIPLTRDHKPSDRAEMTRIQRSGGACEPSYIHGMGFQGPMRVWKKRQQLGGLALSRSVGDTALACAGVVPLPDIVHRELTPQDELLVLGSDGVWDHLKNQQVVQMAARYKDPQAAADAIVKEARRRWTEVGGGYIDDVTALVVRLRPASSKGRGGGGGSFRRKRHLPKHSKRSP